MADQVAAIAPLFLTKEEIAILTGRKLKALQIEALKSMAVPFRVNAAGHPIVARSAIDGQSKREITTAAKWQPAAR